MYNYYLSDKDMSSACQAAVEEWEDWEEKNKKGIGGRYNHNSMVGCYVSKKSEWAVFGYLRWKLKGTSRRVYPEFKKKRHESDIKVEEDHIEIKSLQNKQWARYKRMVPPKQLTKYLEKNAIVVWTTTEGDDQDNCVKIYGWNHASDLEDKGIEVTTICDNIWLPNDSDMRSMDELIDILKV